MKAETREAVLAVDAAFFKSLLHADIEALDALLVDDFQIIDVSQGSVSNRASFIEFVASGTVKFEMIETNPLDSLVRLYGNAVVVIGETLMRFKAPDVSAFSARSRYTHLFVLTQGRGWCLASAQGTAINQ